MWKQPIRQNGARESDFAYTVKLIWMITTFNDSYNELTIKKFIDNFLHYAKLASINWDFYNPDGTPQLPIYDTVVKIWVKKYQWHECYEIFEKEKTHEAKIEALLIYDKKLLKDTITDFKHIDEIDERIEHYFREQKELDRDHTYRIAKLEETKNSIWHRIRERLGLDVEKETEQYEYVEPVDLESDEFMDTELDYLIKMVESQ